MRYLERAARLMANALFILAGVAILTMMVHVTADIVGRVAFNRPITGTLEIVASYYMVACAYLPLAYVQIERSHMVIELFTQNLGERSLLVLDLFSSALGIVFLGLMAWQTFLVALEKTAVREAVEATFYQIPVWPSRWTIVAAVSITAFILALQLVQDTRRLISPSASDGGTRPGASLV